MPKASPYISAEDELKAIRAELVTLILSMILHRGNGLEASQQIRRLEATANDVALWQTMYLETLIEKNAGSRVLIELGSLESVGKFVRRCLLAPKAFRSVAEFILNWSHGVQALAFLHCNYLPNGANFWGPDPFLGRFLTFSRSYKSDILKSMEICLSSTSLLSTSDRELLRANGALLLTTFVLDLERFPLHTSSADLWLCTKLLVQRWINMSPGDEPSTGSDPTVYTYSCRLASLFLNLGRRMRLTQADLDQSRDSATSYEANCPKMADPKDFPAFSISVRDHAILLVTHKSSNTTMKSVNLSNLLFQYFSVEKWEQQLEWLQIIADRGVIRVAASLLVTPRTVDPEKRIRDACSLYIRFLVRALNVCLFHDLGVYARVGTLLFGWEILLGMKVWSCTKESVGVSSEHLAALLLDRAKGLIGALFTNFTTQDQPCRLFMKQLLCLKTEKITETLRSNRILIEENLVYWSQLSDLAESYLLSSSNDECDDIRFTIQDMLAASPYQMEAFHPSEAVHPESQASLQSDGEEPTSSHVRCLVCSASSETLMRCSVCTTAVYCSAKCQNIDWNTHRRGCRKPSYSQLL